MSTFVLVPGAGGAAWYWHRLVPLLEQAGHRAVPVDIREDDPALGLPEYADLVAAACGDATDVVLVGQSMGAFTVPVVADRRPVDSIVLVNPMIPAPHETPGQWWDAVGHTAARVAAAVDYPADFDETTCFLHDLPENVRAAAPAEHRAPCATPFTQPADFDQWPPGVPIRVVLGRDDRFFPLDFARHLARERLGVEPDVLPGGHLLALADPSGLADLLTAYAAHEQR